MTTDTGTEGAGQGTSLGTGLRRDAISFPRALGVSVGIQGPTSGVIVGPAFVASIVGQPGALAQVVALVTMGFVAYAFVRFARRFNTAGSVYAFNGTAIGPRYGFVSAWLLLLVYLSFAAGVFAVTAELAEGLLVSAGVHVAWPWVALVGALLAVALASRGLGLSALSVLVLEAASILLIAVVAVAVIARGGYQGRGLDAAPFTLHGVGVSVLALGVVQVFGQFSGFEGAATLGEETRDSTRAIPRAVALSLLASAAIYIFFTWVVYEAFPSPAALAADPAPLVHVADTFLTPSVGTAVGVAGVISAFGAQVALITAASRLVFALARDLRLPRLARTGRRTGTPTGATALVAVVTVAALLGMAWEAEPGRAATLLIQYGAYLLLVAYGLTVVAGLVAAVRERSPVPVVVLAGGTVVIGYVLARTFSPFPDAPFSWLVLLGAASLALGVGLAAVPRVAADLRGSALLSAVAGSGSQRERAAPNLRS